MGNVSLINGHIDNTERCVCCGREIPEGRQYCVICGYKAEKKKPDLVEVVRCKDCIYYQANSCFNRQWDFESSTEIPMVRETDFCSYGVRKGEE